MATISYQQLLRRAIEALKAGGALRELRREYRVGMMVHPRASL